jgi:hypothetical protein
MLRQALRACQPSPQPAGYPGDTAAQEAVSALLAGRVAEPAAGAAPASAHRPAAQQGPPAADDADDAAEGAAQEDGALERPAAPVQAHSAAPAGAADRVPADGAAPQETLEAAPAEAAPQARAGRAAPPARKTLLSSLFGASLQPRSRVSPTRSVFATPPAAVLGLPQDLGEVLDNCCLCTSGAESAVQALA